ncbi:MAG TPA: DUF192 domain-containing protein [Acetivibrio sp.]|jgi:uncharacterized membrane protein (UPF0127 family)|nr:DUF192 domain-containing protein [Clostridium sp.]HOQ37252.1 DUF192 domain-containing protein [Acetivibrio sp.]HPT90900.1 DUF192 domain-containing protein [Acetivibrio sp.]HQA57895.1 DUF192 domain-containing protein [Acetivibrio sp.]
MTVENGTKGSVLSMDTIIANTFTKRFLGLMFKNSLPDNAGLLIEPCNSIHMFFMKFPLDVVFIGRDDRVVHLIESIPPWKCSKIVFGSRRVLELPAGTIKKTNTCIGDKLLFV